MKTLTERTDAALAWIDEQLALCRAATDGKWSNEGQGCYINAYDSQGMLASENSVAKCFPETWPLHSQMKANAAFISAARSGYPAMLEGMKGAIEMLCAFRPYREDRPALQKILIEILTKIEALQ